MTNRGLYNVADAAMTRPRLLDVYSCAGGASMGYHRAGFDVVGVDIDPQPNYPFEFIQGDALGILADLDFVKSFDAVHASPPCQAKSTVTPKHSRSSYAELIAPTRDLLIATGLPYVIENVQGAVKDLRNPVRLCGSSFLLDVRRHRFFETNWNLEAPPCAHGWQTPRFQSLDNKSRKAGRLASVVGVHGHLNYAGEGPIREAAMGIDWMTVHELAESLPPAYTEWIGQQLIQVITKRD